MSFMNKLQILYLFEREIIDLKLTIFIPAYNEENTIDKVINDIPKTIDGIDEIEVVVVDDGSTDKTAEISREAGERLYICL